MLYLYLFFVCLTWHAKGSLARQFRGVDITDSPWTRQRAAPRAAAGADSSASHEPGGERLHRAGRDAELRWVSMPLPHAHTPLIRVSAACLFERRWVGAARAPQTFTSNFFRLELWRCWSRDRSRLLVITTTHRVVLWRRNCLKTV